MKKIYIFLMICILCFVSYTVGYNTTSNTTNLSLIKILTADDTLDWFDNMNDNLDLIDAIFDTVSLIEFGYLDGVKSAIQDQLDSISAGTGYVDTSGTPEANDIARFTDANTIEGRSYAELKADLDLEIGTDVLAQQSIGIADNYLLEVDGTPNADEYARFTANGLEGRTEGEFKSDFNLEIGTDVQAFDNALSSISALAYVSPSFIKFTANDTYVVRTLAEVKEDLSLNNVENTALTTWAGSEAITTLGTIGTGTWEGTAIANGYIPNDITIDLATLATTFTCTDNEDTAETIFIVFVDGATGAQGAETDGNLTYNPSTGTVTATSYSGDGTNLTGVGAAAATALTISAKAAENIAKGEVVYISGATGPFAEVSLADNTHTDKHIFCGVAAETKTTGQTILIRVRGELTGFDTTSWAEGDVIYLSTGGAITNVRPTSGAIEVLGYVSYDHITQGTIVILHHSAHGIHVPSTDDIIIRMGDAIGANKVYFKDYADVEVASVDSDGGADFNSLILDTPLAVAEGGTGAGTLSSANLSDVASIAMLDENEAITGAWTVSGTLATVDATEFTYLEGVTEEIQTALDTILANVVEDTTPELGGEMDAGAHSIGFTLQTLTGDGTDDIDWRLGNKMQFTFPAGNETFTFTAPTNPCTLMLTLIQDATGSRAITWPATVKWAGGTAPTLTTTANARDKVALDWDGTQYDGVASLDFK